MNLAQKKAEVWTKITNLYSENLQLIPTKEFSPEVGSGATVGFVSREFKRIFGTRTDKRGRTVFVGTKG